MSNFAYGWLLCVEQSQFHTAILSSETSPVAVPRRMAVQGTPTKVIYSPRLNKLIVLYYKLHITSRPQMNRHPARASKPFREYMIAFVDPDSNTDISNDKLEPDDEYGNRSSTIIQGKPGENYLGIIEWFPKNNDGIHHMLIVNTMIEPSADSSIRQPSGRILFFTVSNDDKPKLILKKTIEKNSPVLALASSGSNSLVYCYGTDICLHNLKVTSNGGRWQDPCILSLRSRGHHISISQSFVYVTTSSYGLAILKIEGSKLTHQFNDESARDDLYHLNLPEHSTILTSQKSGTITGLWQPPEKGINNSTSTIFEAKLPTSITRFRRIIRPFWQQSTDTEKISETIIGSSTDGSMFQFDIVSEACWRLLIFIQRLTFCNPAICPYSNHVQARRQLFDYSPRNPFNMHINGNILQRLSVQGYERTLLTMLDREHILNFLISHEQMLMVMLAQHPNRGHIAENEYMEPRQVAEVIASMEAAARQVRITELAREVGLMGADISDLVQKVAQWIRPMLRGVMGDI